MGLTQVIKGFSKQLVYLVFTITDTCIVRANRESHFLKKSDLSNAEIQRNLQISAELCEILLFSADIFARSKFFYQST